MESIWKKEMPPYPFGEEGFLPERVEVAIIGGGMTGILTALMLKRAGIECAVFEKGDAPGYGQSGYTTGKITAQTGLTYAKLEKSRGQRGAKEWSMACQDAIYTYDQLTKEYGLACDFRYLPSYLYTSLHPQLLEEEAQAARRAGLTIRLTRDTNLPHPVSLALAYEKQAQFHPMKFLYGVAKQVRLYLGVNIQKVSGHTLFTEEGEEIEARYIIWACHYPQHNFPGMYFTRLYQDRSYAISLYGVPHLRGAYYGIDKGGISYRSHGRHLIMVGGSHRTGEDHPSPYATLEEAARRYYPYATLDGRWSAQDCMSPDGLPIVGRYSALAPHHFLATGYSKWGMVGSMIAAKIIAGELTNDPYFAAPLCAPNRLGMQDIKAVMTEGHYAISGWKKRLFKVPKADLTHLKPGMADIVLYHGDKWGVYRDSYGRFHFIKPFCSHLGCQLTWNGGTHTWDCPCHGSRFTPDGVPLDSPAVKTLHGGCR